VIADAEPVEEYRYDPTGKPDPFRSFVRLEEDLEDGVSTPLERFDLTQLMVTAIIWGSDRPRALIRDPAGKGYIISAGTPIGKNKGRVVSIGDNMVRVKETYVDFRDRATTKEVEMRLYESQGG
jgi:type IV pilus assembly protein PilP